MLSQNRHVPRSARHASNQAIPNDDLSRMGIAYRDARPAPSHAWYGWVTG